MSSEVQLLEEAISLEMNVSDIYMLFSNSFPDDRDFWWQLCLEEKNHAALLKAGIEFASADIFPGELLFARIEDLQKVNSELTRLKKEYLHQAPSREEAFRAALRLEDSAGESHYQMIMGNVTDSEATKLFQQLNEDDKDHARRILMYAERRNLNIYG